MILWFIIKKVNTLNKAEISELGHIISKLYWSNTFASIILHIIIIYNINLLYPKRVMFIVILCIPSVIVRM